MATNGHIILHPNLATPQPYDGREYGVNSRAVRRVVAAGAEAAGYPDNAGQALLTGGAAMIGRGVPACQPVEIPWALSAAVATVRVFFPDVTLSDGAATAVRVVGGSGGMQVGAAVGCGALAGAAVTHPALAGVVAVVNPVGTAIITGAVVTVAVGSLLWFLCKDRRAYAREMAQCLKVLQCSANETPEAFINVVRSQWLHYHPDNHPNATEEAKRLCHEVQRCNKRYVQLRGWTSVRGAEVVKTVEDSRLKANVAECYRLLDEATTENTFLANAVLSADGRDIVTTDTHNKATAVVHVRRSETAPGGLECVRVPGVSDGLLVRIAVMLPRCDGHAIVSGATNATNGAPIRISYVATDLCVVTFASDAMQFLRDYWPMSLEAQAPSAAATASV